MVYTQSTGTKGFSRAGCLGRGGAWITGQLFSDIGRLLHVFTAVVLIRHCSSMEMGSFFLWRNREGVCVVVWRELYRGGKQSVQQI